MPLSREVQAEVSGLLQEAPGLGLCEAINLDRTAGIHPAPNESYFLCLTADNQGSIMRVLRGPQSASMSEHNFAAVVEFYGFDGMLQNERIKHFEEAGVFAIHYTDAVGRASYFELSGKPSFITPAFDRYSDYEGVSLMPTGRIRSHEQLPELVAS